MKWNKCAMLRSPKQVHVHRPMKGAIGMKPVGYYDISIVELHIDIEYDLPFVSINGYGPRTQLISPIRPICFPNKEIEIQLKTNLNEATKRMRQLGINGKVWMDSNLAVNTYGRSYRKYFSLRKRGNNNELRMSLT